MNKLPLFISTGVGLSAGCIIGGYATIKYLKWFVPKFLDSEEGQAYIEEASKDLIEVILQKCGEAS